MKNKRDEAKSAVNIGLGGAATSTVNKYGSANNEHYKAYSELSKISQYKINPDYQETNYQQQSGFSAEVKQTARTNAKNIIEGKEARISRTDNVGAVNHKQYDHVNVDVYGKPILDGNGNFTGGSQQKVFKNVENYDKLFGHDYDHYKDTPIDVPNDQYEKIISRYENKIIGLEEQKKYLDKIGSVEKSEEIANEINKIKDVKERIRESKVSTKEAMEARKSPLLSTSKDIAKISHSAGIDAAKFGAVIGGSISVVQNFVAYIQDDKDIKDALIDVSKDTAKAAGLSYATGYIGSACKGALQSSNKTIAVSLSKSAAPAMIATAVLEISKTIKRYYNGDIDGVEFFEELGEKGTGILAGSFGAVVGQMAIPIPVVGGMIGSMVGYMLSSIFYNEALNSFKLAKAAKENRIRVEAFCAEAIKQMEHYEKELKLATSQYLNDMDMAFDQFFNSISNAINNNSPDEYAQGINKIAIFFGEKLQFSNFKEFDSFMNTDLPLIL